MITSPANPKLRYVRHLERRTFRARQGRMRLEGVRLVEESLAAGFVPAFVLVGPALESSDRGQALRARLAEAGVPVLDVDGRLFDEVSDTAGPQGILAVVAIPEPAVVSPVTLALVMDGVRDPGNVGTLARTAAAAGVDVAYLAPGTADPTGPKAVRAGMGAHFRLPMLRVGWDDLEQEVSERGLAVWVADARGEVPHTEVDWAGPSALVVGGEAEGASSRALAVGRTVRIEMPGPVESLNAAAAAAVVLFEAVRQRQLAADGRPGAASR